MPFALDGSVRTYDADGRLHVSKSHISKANVCPYYGREIPGYVELGLDADKVYQLLRDPAELKLAANTFARLPVLKEHVPVTVDSPQPDLVIGAIGSDVTFDGTYLNADLSFWDASSIAAIESEQIKELSCAYRYVPVMESGSYNGVAYDGKMTEIKGNHLALVEVGRAGSDVVVADQNPFKPKESAMKPTKLGNALILAISAVSSVLAADSALQALVGSATRKNFKRTEVVPKLIALDASIDSNKLDNIIDAILDVEQDPRPAEPQQAAAADESPVDKVKSLLAGKVDEDVISAICALVTPAAMDADEDDKGMKEDEVKAAMDAYGAKLRAELKAVEDAKRDVRPIVGDVFGLDSANAVYKFALDHLKVDHNGIDDPIALRALVNLASAQKVVASAQVASDSAGLATRFPNANRFGKA